MAGLYRWLRSLSPLFFVLCSILFLSTDLYAVCSEYTGRATVNEVHRQGKNGERFVELKILDSTIDSSIYDTWNVTLCEHQGYCLGPISLALANDATYPWVVVEKAAIPDSNYIDLTNGMDLLLRDSTGATVDYVSFAGHRAQQDDSCTPAYPWTMGGAWTHTAKRIEDGTGPWICYHAQTVPPTKGKDNSFLPNGASPPLLTVSNVTVDKGEAANFVLTLQSDTLYAISFDYQTLDDTAVAVTDYESTSGSVTLAAGSIAGTEVSILVPTVADSGSGEVSFRLFLDNQQNVSFSSNFAYATILEPSVLDHYEIIHDGSALTCAPEEVRIAACETSDCSVLSTSPTTVSLAPNGWIGGDDISFTGSGTVELRHLVAETVPLAVSDQNPIAANGYRCTESLGGPAVSCTMTFFDSGFDFSVPSQTSCKTSAPITITAVRRDLITERCVPAFANRSEDISFWSTYVDPAIGSLGLQVNGTSVAGSPPGTGVRLTFDENGQAAISVAYADAGQLQLDASFSGVGDEAGLIMLGNSSFVIHPAGLCVYSDQGNSECVSGDGTCSAFVAAGTPFALKIRGACWQVDGEMDGAFCDNPATPNFQMDNIQITHTLVTPVSGVDGTIDVTSVDISSGGEALVSQVVSEAGVFTFTADPPGDYLGTGDIFAGATFASTNVGRFIPDHLQVSISPSAPVFAEACAGGNFTYLGQPFDWEVVPDLIITAMNGATPSLQTENYEGDFWKLDTTLSYSYDEVVSSIVLNPATGAKGYSSDIADCGGSVAIALEEASLFSYDRPAVATPVSPFTADVTLTVPEIELKDSDSVCFDTGSGCRDFVVSGISGINLRHGRGVAENVFGPENESLVMPVYTLWYDAAGSWALHDVDSCSAYSYGLTSSNITVSALPASPVVLAEGYGSVTLTPTADPNPAGGTVQVDCDFPEWLHPDSTGTATFGIFRGNDRVINWQEITR